MEVKYSIRDLERLCGIKAHTLRIWESRYGLIAPQRTDTNIRYYLDPDLKRVLNVAALVNAGHRISKVAKMNEDELRSAVLDQMQHADNGGALLHALQMAMLDFDQELFEKVLNQSVMQLGTERAFNEVVASFIRRIGLLWQTDAIAVAHEHFVTNLIKQKLFASIDRLAVQPAPHAPFNLLFLPATELHEMGLLYLHFLLRKRGERSLYLGQDVPLEFLAEVSPKLKPDRVVSILTTTPRPEDVRAFMDRLGNTFDQPNCRFYLAGHPVRAAIEQEGLTGDNRFYLHPDFDSMRLALVGSTPAMEAVR
ncbi:MerR family transcriptional regulator [bacterium]|nr:MerR family transcriptional regulator [bacterium]